MSSRIWKILKHTVIAVLSLAVLFLVLNLFLTGRLEKRTDRAYGECYGWFLSPFFR